MQRKCLSRISLNLGDEIVSSPIVFISLNDLHGIMVLHPGNNKQCVNLAPAVFVETIIVAIRSHSPKWEDMAGVLTLILLLKW